jgi:hypothetical protein
LTGGALSAGGAYIANGGLSSLLSGPTGASAYGVTGKLGTSLDTLRNASTQSTGLLDTIGRGATSLTNALSGAGSGGGISSFVQPAAILSGVQSSLAQDDVEKRLLAAQGKSEKALTPYMATGSAANSRLSDNLAAGFDPGDLTQDPGYQFNLEQGTNALNRTLGAKGKVFSGEAMKAAQEFGQGLADNTYGDAYQRWIQKNQQDASLAAQGLNATGAATQVYDNQGNIKANNIGAKSNILNSTLSSLLSGSGAQQIIGYRQDGSPIYANESAYYGG